MLVKFLCYCCGAKWEILDKCPSQKPLYASIGATILFTALLATISGGYALYFIFNDSPHPLPYAIGFGLIWGLTIFNLDRLIVLSIRKAEKRNIKMELLQALPRLVLAIFISLVIAKPLEIRIFHEQIQQQLLIDSTNYVGNNFEVFDKRFNTRKDQVRYDSLTSVTDSLLEVTQTGKPNFKGFKDKESSLLKNEENLRKYRANTYLSLIHI